MNVTNNTIQQ